MLILAPAEADENYSQRQYYQDNNANANPTPDSWCKHGSPYLQVGKRVFGFRFRRDGKHIVAGYGFFRRF
jgi:hypothetical protein